MFLVIGLSELDLELVDNGKRPHKLSDLFCCSGRTGDRFWCRGTSRITIAERSTLTKKLLFYTVRHMDSFDTPVRYWMSIFIETHFSAPF